MNFTFNLVDAAPAAGGLAATVAAVVYGLKKNGWLTFGKPKERRSCVRLCNEHSGLVSGVEQNAELLKEANGKIDSMDGKINRILGHLGKL